MNDPQLVATMPIRSGSYAAAHDGFTPNIGVAIRIPLTSPLWGEVLPQGAERGIWKNSKLVGTPHPALRATLPP